MQKINIPRRSLRVEQSDDGRRIEWWTKNGEIQETLDDSEEMPELSDDKDIFVGVLHLFTGVGPKEIKFQIAAESIDEAFANFKEYAKITIEDLQKQMQKAEREQANKIIVPDESVDLSNLHV